jgi:signal transduction histidine kinase
VTIRVVTEPSRNSPTDDGRIDRGRIGVEIRDTGRGIPSELRRHLFEEFFRVHSEDEAISGNGLGLAMSRRLARLLGGDVTYAPNEPTGSVFTLWLNIGGPVERAPGDRRQRASEKSGSRA